ncbi:MAG: hypothetical protein WAR79_15185 [Melioribacteraceae bacterium]
MQKLKLVIATIVLSTYIFGQENNSEEKNKLENNYVFDVFVINGYGLSYNYNLSSKSQLRFLLFVLSTTQNSNGDLNYSSFNSDQYSSEESVKSTNKNVFEMHDITFTTQYLFEFYQSNLGAIYFGAGPLISYHIFNNNNKNKINKYTSEQYNYYKSYSIGISSLVGVRSKISKSISILTEVELDGGKEWKNYKYLDQNVDENNTNTSKSTADGNGWYFNIICARVGLRLEI